jgi:hypothetical protein
VNPYDETPKYIKTLKNELNTALRTNKELKNRLELVEEEQTAEFSSIQEKLTFQSN